MRREEREADFTAFVAARQGHLRRIAYAICGDWHLADDLLQITLVKLYVAWPRIRDKDAQEAYARRILVRTHIDETRRPSRRDVPGLEGHDAAAVEATSYEERSELFAALQDLPPMQRKVVVLRHWLGLSVRETADTLGIGEGTVKGYSSRALAALEVALIRS